MKVVSLFEDAIGLSGGIFHLQQKNFDYETGNLISTYINTRE